MPTTIPPTPVIESPGSPNTTFWHEDFGTFIDGYTTAGAEWPLNLAVDLDSLVPLVSPQDTPFLTGLMADGGVTLPAEAAVMTEFYWGTQDIIVPFSRLKVAIAANNTTSIDVVASNRFKVGDVIRMSSELMQVTEITDADTIVVTRGFAGTTALAAIAQWTNIYNLGRRAAEGSDPLDLNGRDRDIYSNYTEIHGPYSIRFTGTAQAVGRNFVGDEVTYQAMLRMKEINITREMSLIHGVKYKSGRTRTSGGLRWFIENAGQGVDATADGSLESTDVSSALSAVWGRGGGEGDLILVANPVTLAQLNAEDNDLVRTTFVESRRGYTPVQTVTTEFGTVTIVRHRWCDPTEALLFSRDQVVRRVLRPMLLERLAKSGDYDSWQMVCEEGLQFRKPQLAARIYNLTDYAAADVTDDG